MLYLNIVKILATLGEHPFVSKAICDADYLGSLSKTLVKLAPGLSPNSSFEKSKHILMLCVGQGGNPLSNFLSVLDGGLLCVLVPVLAGRNTEDLRPKEDISYYMIQLEPYLVYPSMIKCLLKATDRILPKAVQKLSNISSTVGEVWTHLLSRAQIHTKELEQMDEEVADPICDNNKLHKSSLRPHSRSCSNCRLVVYCSTECQREDWRKRHRAECSIMRSTHRERCNQGVRYGQRSRAFHLHSISAIFTESYKTPKDDYDAASSTKAILSLDLRFPLTSWDDSFDILSIEDYLEERTHGDCAPIGTRVKTIVHKHINNPSPNVWLVELRLPSSMGDLHVPIALYKFSKSCLFCG
ncbi:hypothetical protein BKA70DRAFT_1314568 [Coprinopsis sp. MPI-PUGE-AT-0042]|nr:hypothetical protein BKA70DRAFT_1314568 [Coprinopsis sp. MPI-PUGE-AT-0042]